MGREEMNGWTKREWRAEFPFIARINFEGCPMERGGSLPFGAIAHCHTDYNEICFSKTAECPDGRAATMLHEIAHITAPPDDSGGIRRRSHYPAFYDTLTELVKKYFGPEWTILRRAHTPIMTEAEAAAAERAKKQLAKERRERNAARRREQAERIEADVERRLAEQRRQDHANEAALGYHPDCECDDCGRMDPQDRADAEASAAEWADGAAPSAGHIPHSEWDGDCGECAAEWADAEASADAPPVPSVADSIGALAAALAEAPPAPPVPPAPPTIGELAAARERAGIPSVSDSIGALAAAMRGLRQGRPEAPTEAQRIAVARAAGSRRYGRRRRTAARRPAPRSAPSR